ncbi:MAG: hypothetical protein O7B99_13770 [Planctomycetota bacterium]|nr:hypothetical protein [Planctomycetota bacterium]
MKRTGMKRNGTRISLPFLLVVLLAAPGAADKIYRTDGKVIEGVNIVEETLTHVIYKKGNAQSNLASADVIRVEFERKPRLVDEADQALVEEDPIGALEVFDDYVDGQIRNPKEKKKWAPAYAAFRALEVCKLLDDLPGLVSRADRLIQNFPDSRYLPETYLAKANALARQGKTRNAQGVLRTFLKLVDEKTLSKRWALECQLGLILTDEATKGAAKRDKLVEIVSEAGGQFPTVRSRAEVAQGETFVKEAEQVVTKDGQKAVEFYKQALGIFTGITNAQKADAATLAGAYTGRGDALINQGIIGKDTALIQEALMAYLRVVVNYEEHSQYVAKSMFQAMRCFELLEDRERKAKMRFELKARYPNSNWAQIADNY